MFNALRYTEEMERAGFTRSHAETSVKLLIDVMNENFATKSDILMLKSDLQSVESSIRELEYRLTIKLGSMLVIGLGVIATVCNVLLPGGSLSPGWWGSSCRTRINFSGFPGTKSINLGAGNFS
jgi:hypothetical protein